jgi:hypothetical protein
MACSVNGCGVISYGQQNREKVLVEGDQVRDELLEYDTTLWITLLWIPLLPLGTRRIRTRPWSRWRAWVPGFQQEVLILAKKRLNGSHLLLWVSFLTVLALVLATAPPPSHGRGPGVVGGAAYIAWLCAVVANTVRARVKTRTRLLSLTTHVPSELRELAATVALLRQEVAQSAQMGEVRRLAAKDAEEALEVVPSRPPKGTLRSARCPRCKRSLRFEEWERAMAAPCKGCGALLRIPLATTHPSSGPGTPS